MISLGNAKNQFEIGTSIIAVQILSMEVCLSPKQVNNDFLPRVSHQNVDLDQVPHDFDHYHLVSSI
jgi:hypothetical protein